eukprot:5657129-Amphidinium_carterae.1
MVVVHSCRPLDHAIGVPQHAWAASWLEAADLVPAKDAQTRELHSLCLSGFNDLMRRELLAFPVLVPFWTVFHILTFLRKSASLKDEDRWQEATDEFERHKRE